MMGGAVRTTSPLWRKLYGNASPVVFIPPAVELETEGDAEPAPAWIPVAPRHRDMLDIASNGCEPPTVRASSRQTALDNVERIATASAINMADIFSEGRTLPVVRARQAAMWAVARDTHWSLPMIGRFFNRDHSTVYHAIGSENELRGENVRGIKSRFAARPGQ